MLSSRHENKARRITTNIAQAAAARLIVERPTFDKLIWHSVRVGPSLSDCDCSDNRCLKTIYRKLVRGTARRDAMARRIAANVVKLPELLGAYDASAASRADK